MFTWTFQSRGVLKVNTTLIQPGNFSTETTNSVCHLLTDKIMFLRWLKTIVKWKMRWLGVKSWYASIESQLCDFSGGKHTKWEVGYVTAVEWKLHNSNLSDFPVLHENVHGSVCVENVSWPRRRMNPFKTHWMRSLYHTVRSPSKMHLDVPPISPLNCWIFGCTTTVICVICRLYDRTLCMYCRS